MYYYILLTHMYAAMAYLLFHTVRIYWILFKTGEGFVTFRKNTRVIEIGLSTVFPLTGISLISQNSGAANLFFVIKMIMVFGSIPVSIIAFKRGNKILALLSWLMLVMAYGLAEMNKKQITSSKNKTEVVIDQSATADKKMEAGKHIYIEYCTGCHGMDGKLGMAGAKDLTVSALNMDEVRSVITNGKRAMPAFGRNNKPLNNMQIEAVMMYIDSLRN